jgi:hypothetical protein
MLADMGTASAIDLADFNVTVEMPLKAIVRGFPHAVVPVTWTNRQTGISKLNLKEMGSCTRRCPAATTSATTAKPSPL